MTSVRGDDPDTSGAGEPRARVAARLHRCARRPHDDLASSRAPSRHRRSAAGTGDGELRPPNRRATPWWKETLLLVGTALILALIIKTFFVQAFYIPSGSMENTLKVNDRILVQKVSYWFGSPQRGDIVVFNDPDNWLGEEGGVRRATRSRRCSRSSGSTRAVGTW